RRQLAMIEEDDIDLLRRLGDVEDRIALPVDARHLLLIEAHFFPETAARRLDDIAFYRIMQERRVDDAAAVMRDGEALRARLAATAIDLNFGRNRNDSPAAPHISDALAAHEVGVLVHGGAGDALLPAEFLGCGFDRRSVPAAQMPKTEIDSIRVRGQRQLVDEALTREIRLRPQRIAHVRGAQRRDPVEQRRDRLPSIETVGDLIPFFRRAEEVLRMQRRAPLLSNEAVAGV